MQNIFIIEAVSTGRFYAKEIAWRGYHPVVIYPYLENITGVYKQYRIGGSDYARKFTDDIIFMESDSSDSVNQYFIDPEDYINNPMEYISF